MYIVSKFDSVLMASAFLWSELSTCNRRQVGCVIAKDSRILSTGYNGTISGTNNKCEEDIIKYKTCSKCSLSSVTNQGYDTTDQLVTTCLICNNSRKEPYRHDTITKETVLHAEQNALMFALKEGISTKNATLYCTDAPCVTCSKLIAQAGITKVFYSREYHDTKGADLLAEVGVEVQKLEKN